MEIDNSMQPFYEKFVSVVKLVDVRGYMVCMLYVIYVGEKLAGKRSFMRTFYGKVGQCGEAS